MTELSNQQIYYAQAEHKPSRLSSEWQSIWHQLQRGFTFLSKHEPVQSDTSLTNIWQVSLKGKSELS